MVSCNAQSISHIVSEPGRLGESHAVREAIGATSPGSGQLRCINRTCNERTGWPKETHVITILALRTNSPETVVTDVSMKVSTMVIVLLVSCGVVYVHGEAQCGVCTSDRFDAEYQMIQNSFLLAVIRCTHDIGVLVVL